MISNINIQGVNTTSAGLFRITLGIAILLDLVLYKFSNIKAFYTDEGILTTKLLSWITQTYECSLLYYISSPGFVYAFFIVLFALCSMYTIGFKPKLMGLIAYIFLYSIHERNAPFLTGADAILRVSLFWSLFLPIGKEFNIFNRKQEPKKEVRSVPVYAFLLQIALIYLVNAINKSGETWMDGTAIAYAVMIPFHRGYFADVILQSEALYSFLTYATLAIEYLIPILIFLPFFNGFFRFSAAILIFILHWASLPFLNVGHFYLAALPLAVLIIPKEIWQKWRKDEFVQQKSFSYLRDAAAIIAITAVLIMNIEPLINKRLPLSKKLTQHTCNCLGLIQRWKMFAPDPTRKNGYSFVIGKIGENYIDLYSEEDFMKKKLEEFPLQYNSLPYSYIYLDNFIERFMEIPLLGENIAKNWAEYELEKWNNKHPAYPAREVYISRLTMESVAPGKIDSIDLKLLYKYP